MPSTPGEIAFAKDSSNLTRLTCGVANPVSIQREVLQGQTQPQAQREILGPHPASGFLLRSSFRLPPRGLAPSMSRAARPLPSPPDAW